MGYNMIIFVKKFQVLIFENIHITKSYIIKFLVNILNHGNNLQDLNSQNICENRWTAVTFCHLLRFSWTKTTRSFFISKIIIHEIRLCKEKHMLTNNFSCYKLNKTSTLFQEEKNSPKLKNCQIFYVIRVLGY